MTTAIHTTAPASHPAPASWLFPGRIDLGVVVNWKQAATDAGLRDLELARRREEASDLTLIARLRRLSAECSRTLALCSTEFDAVPGGQG